MVFVMMIMLHKMKLRSYKNKRLLRILLNSFSINTNIIYIGTVTLNIAHNEGIRQRNIFHQIELPAFLAQSPEHQGEFISIGSEGPVWSERNIKYGNEFHAAPAFLFN